MPSTKARVLTHARSKQPRSKQTRATNTAQTTAHQAKGAQQRQSICASNDRSSLNRLNKPTNQAITHSATSNAHYVYNVHQAGISFIHSVLSCALRILLMTMASRRPHPVSCVERLRSQSGVETEQLVLVINWGGEFRERSAKFEQNANSSFENFRFSFSSTKPVD